MHGKDALNIYSLDPCIRVTNETKKFHWVYYPTSSFSSEVREDIMWLSFWWFENQIEHYDGEDMSWRFKNEMEGGDRVNVSVGLSMNYNIPIKKFGVHLLYQQNDPACFEIKEPADVHSGLPTKGKIKVNEEAHKVRIFFSLQGCVGWLQSLICRAYKEPHTIKQVIDPLQIYSSTHD